MNWVDFILNIAGLLLWLNWRAGKGDPLGKRTPATLVGTLRRAEPLRMQWWHLPLVLGAFLFLRAVALLANRPGFALGGNAKFRRHFPFFPQRLVHPHFTVFVFKFCADARHLLFVVIAAFAFKRAAGRFMTSSDCNLAGLMAGH